MNLIALPGRIARLPRAAAFVAALAVSFTVPTTASGQQTPPVERIRIASIEIEGNARVSDESIQGVLSIRAGDEVTRSDLDRSMSRLWGTGQFADVKLVADEPAGEPGQPVALRIILEERPVLASVEFRGLENVSGNTVRDTSALNTGQPLDPSNIERATYMVRKLLADKGFFAKSVTHRIEEVPDQPHQRRLIFEVEEGQRVAVAQVDFEGNDVFDDDRLEGVIGTKSEGFLWFRSGTFDRQQFVTDVRERLPSFYRESGYLDFGITGDTLIVDPQTGKARLVIDVQEGQQYRLASFDIQGNRVFSSEQLRRYFEQERGGLLSNFGIGTGPAQVEGESAFDEVSFHAAAAEVNQLYRNQGYLRAYVQPIVDRVPATDSTPPRVRATWLIQEGQPAFIDEVRIVGNTYTHENVIRNQLLVIPGDVYSDDRIIQSMQRITALGFFESPLDIPDIQEDPETGDVDITFRVTERQTGSVNFGTALGGVTGIAGFLGYDQPNLFGQAKSGHLRWEFGRYSNNFEASYSDPAIAGTRYSGSLSLFSSRDRFFTFSEGQRRRTGAGLRIGFPLFFADRWTRLSIGYSLSRTTYEEFENEASSLFSLPPGVQSTFTVSLERNLLDNPLFPVVGTRAELTADLNGGILGGDGNFQKYTMTGEWYVPVGELGGDAPGSRPIRLTLGLTAEAGVLFGDASRFPFDRFWLGGVQFGRPLRGYDETTITPSGYISRDAPNVALNERFGDAYLRLSAQWAVRLNDNMSLGLFYDAGNVWRDPASMNPGKLARGAGMGITIVTPFGPLGLDYAYGFDKVPPGWQLHFKFGQLF
jgi:outer membrane protein insertion porin family